VPLYKSTTTSVYVCIQHTPQKQQFSNLFDAYEPYIMRERILSEITRSLYRNHTTVCMDVLAGHNWWCTSMESSFGYPHQEFQKRSILSQYEHFGCLLT